MPHSPYTQIVHPPITDLESYKTSVGGYRARLDEGDRDKHDADELLDIAEVLLEQIDFLEGKIDSKNMKINALKKSLNSTEAELNNKKDKLDTIQEQLTQQRREGQQQIAELLEKVKMFEEKANESPTQQKDEDDATQNPQTSTTVALGSPRKRRREDDQ